MARPDDVRFESDEEFAHRLDADDPLGAYRGEFLFPRRADGEPVTYLAGNSLGLQPRSARAAVEQELDAWADRAVDAHFEGDHPWFAYHENFRESGARLVGAKPGEVVMMNSLTVNLHLMMVSFYRPAKHRYKIVIDYPHFPSDVYAVKSQLRFHGIDPSDGLIVVRPRDGEHTLRIEDIETMLATEGEHIALVLLSAVNFFTGQLFDLPRITAAAQCAGCIVGFDLAHAVGNVPLQLHDWNIDFAVWCSYKYLNCGPGAPGGCFVHGRHGQDEHLTRFAGWWGNDPESRFLMHLQPEFIPRTGADGWQLSNPPILAMAPLRASLTLFDEIGMDALRGKSKLLTGYLHFLIESAGAETIEIITPDDPSQRGAQLSFVVHDRARERFAALLDRGVVCDFRQPDVIRAAPAPLYNSFHDVWTFAKVLTQT